MGCYGFGGLLSLTARAPRESARGFHELQQKVLVGPALVLGLLSLAGLSRAQAASSAVPPSLGSDVFDRFHEIRLRIAPADAAALRRSPRQFVRAMARETTNRFPDIGLHLKGSTGSFRPLDDKPSFTLEFDRFVSGQKFHGLRKIHLNNSVEDPSYLNEMLGSELFRRAGLPAPRTGHARVELNGRPLGLYVLKEGFTGDFLAQHFRNPTGNLYEPEEGSDVNGRLKRNTGAGPDDRADLKALAAALAESEPNQRWQRLPSVLDLDRFLSFMAVEVLAGHRDGYCLARNNYRLYHDADSGRMIFLPQGMDNLMRNAELPLQPQMGGLVARAVMESSQGRARYRERIALVFTNVFSTAILTRSVEQWAARIAPVFTGKAALEFDEQVTLVKERIARRAASVARQLAEPEPAPLQFTNGIAKLGSWRPTDPPAGGEMRLAGSPDERPCLYVRAGPVTAASWRSKVLLSRGRYRFEAMARVSRVGPLSYGKNQGAGIRVSGIPQAQPYRFTGDSSWKKLTIDFEVPSPTLEIELSCDLRASHGEVWFDSDSLQLVRLP